MKKPKAHLCNATKAIQNFFSAYSALNKLLTPYSLLLTALLLSLALSGCADPRKDKIRSAIGEYNTLLSESLKTQKPFPLEKIAVDSQVVVVAKSISDWQKENRFMESKQAALAFLSIEIKESEATVKTRENWKYRFHDRQTGKPIAAWDDVEYWSTYTLIRLGDDWKIARFTIDTQN